MSLSQEAYENGWGYKLDLGNESVGFILFSPLDSDTDEIKRLGFSQTKMLYGGYGIWVTVAKGQRIIEVISFFRRHNLPLLSEEELVEKCFPFRIKGYRPRRS